MQFNYYSQSSKLTSVSKNHHRLPLPVDKALKIPWILQHLKVIIAMRRLLYYYYFMAPDIMYLPDCKSWLLKSEKKKIGNHPVQQPHFIYTNAHVQTS